MSHVGTTGQKRTPELSKKRAGGSHRSWRGKTGKAIAGAAKGAAVGGPYGAAAVALWQKPKNYCKDTL